jgi:hypothetical protein
MTIMIKCLDSENAYRSYPTMDQTLGVGGGTQDNRGMSKNELIPNLELMCGLDSLLKYDCN